MQSDSRLVLQSDAGPLLDALNQVRASLEPLHEVRDGLLDLCEFPSELVRLEADSLAASGAGQVFIRFQPSDRLLSLLAAVRAGDV